MSYKHISYSNMQTFSEQLKAKYATITALESLQTKVEGLISTGGEANILEGVKVNGAALTIAEKMVDILIAVGTENGTISVNGANVAVAGLQALAYKAEVSESDLDTALAAVIAAKAEASDVTALSGKVSILIGTTEGDDAKSVRDISAEEVAKIVADAPEAYDTLVEIAEWISDHTDSVATMNAQINTNRDNIASLTALIGSLPEGATSTTIVEYIAEAIGALGIGDYAKTTEVTTAITTALADYYTKTEVDTKLADYVKTADIETVTDEEMIALLADETE